MKKTISIFLVLFFSLSFINAQEKEKKNKATFAAKIAQNSVGGFFPIFFGNFETNKNFDITTYTIFWNNPNFGSAQAQRDLLLETGVGVGLKLFNNDLYLNPSLGFTLGKFSAVDKSTDLGTRVGNALVPNLFLIYNKGLFELEAYIGHYTALRKDGGVVTQDYLLNWAAPGVKVGKRVVLGAFYESFGVTRADNGGNTPLIYRWLGGSIKLKFDNGIALRVSGGPTIETDIGIRDDFYKASVFIPFN